MLWRAFDADARPFLYRADRTRSEDGAALKVLVQAEVEARWDVLNLPVASVEQVYREVSLRAGERLRFFLRANPTVARKGRKEPVFATLEGDAFRAKRGRRVALVGESDRLLWLGRKAEAAGFGVVGVRAGNARPWRWLRGDGSASVRHDGVDFEGDLEVHDPEKLGAALRAGIGSAKAFGFGLLSLARGGQ
jgi:CRISPR system Cascade subunit CasE